MSSSPQRSPRSTPRSTPKRTPLQERTQSEANEISSRLRRDPKPSVDNRNVYAASPFPTKPQQILLPSTLRKQKSSPNLVADIFGSGSGDGSRQESRHVARDQKRPTVRLKRSVKTLRDLYEAQADESRPSTALSGIRPGTSSSRLRSASSNEGLSGRFAWELLSRVSSDDLALLPSLPDGSSNLKRLGSKSSFTSRAARQAVTSSPNFRVLDATSSPKIPVYKDLSEVSSEAAENSTAEPTSNDESDSSPNVVALARTSSVEDWPAAEPRNAGEVKLGASSPVRTIVGVPPSSPVQRLSSTSSSASGKRKRSETDEGRSFAARTGAANSFPSSPPLITSDHSAGKSTSPPPSDSLPSSSIADSSPIIRVLRHDSSSIGQSSVAESHANLQEAISSSPVRPIQYPVVRAPAEYQSAGIVIPKRKYRSSHTTDSLGPRWPARLAAMSSQDSFTRSRNVSQRSSWTEDADDMDFETLDPAQAYILGSANNSQIRIVPDADRHEGEDEVSALPGDEYGYRSSPVVNRSTSYLGSSGSSQSRLNSLELRLERIRSHSHSRQNSMRSFRPDSSSSAVSTLVVPTWARRYYSGFYPDSFRFLAASTSNVNVNQMQSPPQPPPKRPESLATTRSSGLSLASVRESLTERIPSIFRSRNRPRLEARKSHSIPGLGPLVSNPVRGPATAAMSGALQTQAVYNGRPTIRPVSFPLSLQDPRAHWNGIAEGLEHIPEHQIPAPSQSHLRPASAGGPPSSSQSVIYYPRRGRWATYSPHLHHDHRLNTGSTASRGFGAPFNRKSYLSAPSLYEEPPENSLSASQKTQAICFLVGFVLPLSWFFGAVLPLPQRPDSYQDIEKSHWERAHDEGMGAQETDILARLKMEKQMRGSDEVMWQHVRWWRMLNRWMSAVGVLVVVLVVVLAVIGTRGW